MIRRAARFAHDLTLSGTRTLQVLALAPLAALLVAAPASAQDEEFSGVRLGLVYENAYVPALGVQQFSGRLGGGSRSAGTTSPST